MSPQNTAPYLWLAGAGGPPTEGSDAGRRLGMTRSFSGIPGGRMGCPYKRHTSKPSRRQPPCDNKSDVPFVITVEPSPEQAVREAVEKMSALDFLLEPPLALPMETGL